MRISNLVFFLLLLLPVSTLCAQGKEKYGRSKASVSKIDQARRARLKDPEYAIKLLSQLIKEKAPVSEVVEAYTLLGDLYGDVEQHDLAIERYTTALQLSGEMPAVTVAGIHRRAGDAHVKLNALSAANSAYERCFQMAPPASSDAIACRQALRGLTALKKRETPYSNNEETLEYSTEFEDTVQALNSRLKNTTAVLRGQNNIDLTVKELDAADLELAYQAKQMQTQRMLIYLLAALLFVALASVIIILRNVRKRRRANQELLLRNLQTRMNPHFIFNSLNSINNYIARQDERSANRYLGRFAKLMRKVLDQSGQDFIPLSEEIAQLELYLELEQERFAGQFTYDIVVAEAGEMDRETVVIPPMLVQPYVENAIWHGLRYRPDSGELRISIDVSTQTTSIKITDNGVGRMKSAALKTRNQLKAKKKGSYGMDITRKRIELINDHYHRNIQVDIQDAFPSSDYPGTQVTLLIA